MSLQERRVTYWPSGGGGVVAEHELCGTPHASSIFFEGELAVYQVRA